MFTPSLLLAEAGYLQGEHPNLSVGSYILLDSDTLSKQKINREDVWFRIFWTGKQFQSMELILTRDGKGLIYEFNTYNGIDDPQYYEKNDIDPIYVTAFTLPKIGIQLLKETILVSGYFEGKHFESPRITTLSEDGVVSLNFPSLNFDEGSLIFDIQLNTYRRRLVWTWFPQVQMAYIMVNLFSLSEKLIEKENRKAAQKLRDLNQWSAEWFRRYAKFMEQQE